MIFDYKVLLIIYKYIKVVKACCFHFGIRDLHNAFLLALYEFDTYNNQRFYGGRGTLLLDKVNL